MSAPATFTVERHYALSASEHWSRIMRYDELAEAMEGQVRYVGLPEGEIAEGQSYSLKLFLLGWLPIGSWHIEVLERNDAERRVRSFEQGGAVKSWRHTLTVTPDGTGCIHRDTLEIEAGWLTGFYVRTARKMYEQRHDLRAHLRGESA
ncbi:SRPBCC family protein [Marinicauda sp. Alg238-R41]|uniref:SRPBCC family protein n=1 Tax=Marinicauda sp. Alg238-R41 TaxID=2993447 RepID=UPI0022E41F8B|nr:hypothetical protein [Marinicauda sp. Alg238-R41]